MLNEEEYVLKFQNISQRAHHAKDQFGMTKDWYLKALASSSGMSFIELKACEDELTRRMDSINELEQQMSAYRLTENTPNDVLDKILAIMEEIIQRMVEMQQWILAEGDRLGLPR